MPASTAGPASGTAARGACQPHCLRTPCEPLDSVCKTCDFGTFAEGMAATGCWHCPSGKYQDAAVYDECVACADGTWTADSMVGLTECVMIPTPCLTMADGAACQEDPPDAYVFSAGTVQGKRVSNVCIRRGCDSVRFRTGAFGGDLQRVRATVLAVPCRRTALPEVVPLLKRSLTLADPALAVSKKARTSTGRTFANFCTGLLVGFLQCGFAALETLPAPLTARLLTMHARYLPDKNSGEPVHCRGGSRTRGCVTPTGTGEAHFYTKSRGRRGTFTPSEDQLGDVRLLCEHLSHCTGRDPARLMLWVDFMLSFPGQTPQQWHQDGAFSLLGFVVLLTPGRAPEFAPYVGASFMVMRQAKREEFLRSAWQAAEDCPPGSERTLGQLPAGGVVATHTAHIHRQPRAPPSGLRRSIFVAYETEATACDLEVITAGNFATSFPTSRRDMK